MSTFFIKKPAWGILTIMLTAISMVASLAWISLREVNRNNGFTRAFSVTGLVQLNVKEKEKTIVGICGATPYHIYFKTADPARLWVTDNLLENGKYITLNIPNGARVSSAFSTEVDSPFVNVMAGNVPGIIKADINGGPPFLSRFPTALFTRAVVISNDTYLFRGFDTTEKLAGQIFIKGNTQTRELKRAPRIVDQGLDRAGISTDGYLNYDQQTGLLMFVSFYRNKFFCIDTNLNLIYASHTIDTMTNFQVETGESSNFITNTTPTREINDLGRASNGQLYNLSKLRADNEMTGRFSSNAVIDKYDIRTGKYNGSLYIPYYKREKISDFRIVGDKLLVLYRSYLILYQLPRGNG